MIFNLLGGKKRNLIRLTFSGIVVILGQAGYPSLFPQILAVRRRTLHTKRAIDSSIAL